MYNIELDTERREVAVPLDLQAALDGDAFAKAAFEKLSYSNQRRLVEPIVSIKNPEARARRVQRTIEQLR